MKALVVEDVGSVRKMLCAMLKKTGVENIIDVDTGKRAIDLVVAQVPDLMFLDIRLPDMSGLDVLSEIRKKHPDMYIVIATGYKDGDVVQEIIRLGANQYILKPFEYDDVLQIVNTVMRKRSV